ncbi:UNVERIFIED_CONTAM: putative nitric oxide synthase [Sesamum radiatum]|uniref:Nitric oxide synthase n=1 Tax=Sesamum radiatum TaxID=300843 RepID=A0AAW2KDS5_SESRA
MASLKSCFRHSVASSALRSYVAEFISTFLFVFAAVGATMASGKMTSDAGRDSSSLIATAVASAFSLSVAVFISANVSGGHVNPAVTFGMAVGGHISIPMAIFYWIAQMLGSVMACLLLKITTVGQQVPLHPIPPEMTGFGASILEGVMTFSLVYTMYASADPRRELWSHSATGNRAYSWSQYSGIRAVHGWVNEPGMFIRSCCYWREFQEPSCLLGRALDRSSHCWDPKKKHRQLRTVLCGRCRLLSHGHMITAVGGNGGYSGGKQFVTAEELREKLSHLRQEKALVVKLVDVVDFNGSFLARVRDLAGANPIILVVTKVDLLPKGTDLNCVGDWVVEATVKKKLNVLSVHLTSSKSLVGIAGVISEIQKEKKGSANVGKSAFINALLRSSSCCSQKIQTNSICCSGTTLGPIQIEAFLGGGKLYDTPGVHLHHRQAAVIHSEDLPALAPQSRLRGQPFPNPHLILDNSMVDQIKSNGLVGFSIFWGGLVRIDVIKVLPETRLTFYGPKALQIHVVPTEEADKFYEKEVGIILTPPTGKQKAETWMGLETKRELQLKYDDIDRPACDVAISGLGWISVEPFSQSLRSSETSTVEAGGEISLVVHVPKPVEIFVRPPLPVGSAGAEWYQYRELTEMEQEVRPKWYY